MHIDTYASGGRGRHTFTGVWLEVAGLIAQLDALHTQADTLMCVSPQPAAYVALSQTHSCICRRCLQVVGVAAAFTGAWLEVAGLQACGLLSHCLPCAYTHASHICGYQCC